MPKRTSGAVSLSERRKAKPPRNIDTTASQRTVQRSKMHQQSIYMPRELVADLRREVAERSLESVDEKIPTLSGLMVEILESGIADLKKKRKKQS